MVEEAGRGAKPARGYWEVARGDVDVERRTEGGN
jgi:hypothetical protein